MPLYESLQVRDLDASSCHQVLHDIDHLRETLLYDLMCKLINEKVNEQLETLKGVNSSDIQLRISQGALAGYEYGTLVLKDIASRMNRRLERIARKDESNER